MIFDREKFKKELMHKWEDKVRTIYSEERRVATEVIELASLRVENLLAEKEKFWKEEFGKITVWSGEQFSKLVQEKYREELEKAKVEQAKEIFNEIEKLEYPFIKAFSVSVDYSKIKSKFLGVGGKGVAGKSRG